jgi:hypothetical protein
MRYARILGTMVVLFGMSANYAHANDTTGTSDATAFAARLSGFNEVPLTILSPGSGSVQVNIDRAASTITYTLTYADTTTPVTQAHIHFGKKHTAGGIIAFLCSNLANPPAGTPPCPQQGGTVNGTIAAGQVVAQEAQNIPAGDFNALVSAIVSETGYANVHTTRFPAGEIRGQLRDSRHGGHGNHGQHGSGQ